MKPRTSALRCFLAELAGQENYLIATANKAFRDVYHANENAMIEAGFTLHMRRDPFIYIARFYPAAMALDRVVWSVLDATRKLLAITELHVPELKGQTENALDDLAEPGDGYLLAEDRAAIETELAHLSDAVLVLYSRDLTFDGTGAVALNRIEKVRELLELR